MENNETNNNEYKNQPYEYGQNPQNNAQYRQVGRKDYGSGATVAMSIIGIICCNIVSLVLGIIALVYNSKASKAGFNGDIAIAEESRKSAHILSLVSVISGIVITVAAIIAYAIMVKALVDMPSTDYESTPTNKSEYSDTLSNIDSIDGIKNEYFGIDHNYTVRLL